MTQTSIKLNRHNIVKVDSLIEQFVIDYNFNMQQANEERIKEDAKAEEQ